MTLISELQPYYDTQDADIIAADIPVGKIAYGSGGRIVGTKTVPSSVILDWNFEGADGAYIPVLSDAIQAHPSMELSLLDTFTREGGYLKANTGTPDLIFDSVPAFTKTWRRWIVTGKATDAAGLIDININRAGGLDFVFCRLINTTGDWTLQIYTITGGTTTLRASQAMNTSIEDCYFTLQVDDYGDTVILSCVMWEDGSTNIEDAQSIVWYENNRANKSATDFRIDWELGTSVLINHILVVDM